MKNGKLRRAIISGLVITCTPVIVYGLIDMYFSVKQIKKTQTEFVTGHELMYYIDNYFKWQDAKKTGDTNQAEFSADRLKDMEQRWRPVRGTMQSKFEPK